MLALNAYAVAEPRTRRRVRTSTLKRPAKVLVGYSADVEIILAGRDKVLRIPTAAIQEGGRVLLFNADSSKLEARQIKTGLSNWEYTEVLEGLKAGDRIVTSLEKEGVKAGAVVTPDEKAKAK